MGIDEHAKYEALKALSLKWKRTKMKMCQDTVDFIIANYEAARAAKTSEISEDRKRLIRIAQFVHDRMINVHGEDEHVDYLWGLRDVIKHLRTTEPVTGLLEKCKLAAQDAIGVNSTLGFGYNALARHVAKAVLDAAGVKYGD